MSKGPWESRVGMLLDPERHLDFMYSYKPPDLKHGGQPKIDWFACDRFGYFWLIEVKQVADDRKSINVGIDVTAGQRDGLYNVSYSDNGVALLAVGHRDILYFFDWRLTLLWLIGQENLLLPLSESHFALVWNGKKGWQEHSLFDRLYDFRAMGQTPTEPAKLSLVPEPSAPILKPKGSTPIVPLMRPLEP